MITPATLSAPDLPPQRDLTCAQPAGDPPHPPPDDGWRLLALISVIVLAALMVVAGLCAAVAIETWWALASIMALHLITTLAVFATVVMTMSDRDAQASVRPGIGRRRRASTRARTVKRLA